MTSSIAIAHCFDRDAATVKIATHALEFQTRRKKILQKSAIHDRCRHPSRSQSPLGSADIETARIKQMFGDVRRHGVEAAAETIQQMAESGKLDMAVKILAGMKERQTAQLLSLLLSQSRIRATAGTAEAIGSKAAWSAPFCTFYSGQ